jgi:hypothetical protein
LNDLHDLDEFLPVDAAVLLEPGQDLVDGPRGLAQAADLVLDRGGLDTEGLRGLIALAVEETLDLVEGEPMNFRVTICWSLSRSASV